MKRKISKLLVYVICLLAGFILVFAVNVHAKASNYISTELKHKHFNLYVERPQCFSLGENFFIDIRVTNVSAQTFINGDVTVSFKGDVVCEVAEHNATTTRYLPRNSRIFSVEEQKSIFSEDPIIQVLKDNWQPQQMVSFRLKIVGSTPPLTMLVRMAGKLKGEKNLIFEPTDGEKDQQWLHAESFYMDRFPVGVLKAEQSFQDYTVRIYEDPDNSFEGSFEILQNGHQVYTQTGNRFQVGNIRRDEKQSNLISMGKDITGDGKPDLVVSEWSGGAHSSYNFCIFEISEEFRLLDVISIDNDTVESEFVDLDKDSKLEFIMSDGTFAYWGYPFSNCPMPRVVLSFRDGAYRLATDLMRKPASTFLELTEHAGEILDSDDWKTQTAWPPSELWSYMLDLIYTGHAGLAWKFFDMAWPPNLPGKDDTLSFFKNQLSKSEYWTEIQKMSDNEQDPRLLGDFDFNGDGIEEVFLEWSKGEFGEIHQYQIYQKKASGEYALIGEFELEGMPSSGVEFIKEPDPNQPSKVIFNIQGGSYYGTYYLLRRDGKFADELRAASHEEFLDLDNDGIYELIFGQYHNFDERFGCNFLNIRYFEIFQWNNNFSYQRIWPPEGWRDYGASSGGNGYQVGGMRYDMDDDGKEEIVALTDTGEKGDKGRELSIYKLSDRNYTLLSKVDLTYPYTAIDILGIRRLRDRKQIVLQLEEFRSSEELEKSIHGKLVLEGYDFKDKHLEFVWLNEQIKVAVGRMEMDNSSVSIADTDGDGEEEMVFKTGEADKPIVLKGEKEFLR